MPEIKEPLCFSCQHLITYPHCEAFPKGIPKEIRNGTISHMDEVDGDNGITYTMLQHPQDVELTLTKKRIEKMRRAGIFEKKNS